MYKLQETSKITDLIWIQTAFVGDLVLTTGALKLMQSKYPHLKQHLITTKAGLEIFADLDFVHSVIHFDKGQKLSYQIFREVKKKLSQYKINHLSAVVLQVHRSLRSSLLAKYIGVPTITYKESIFSFLAQVRVKRDKSFHEAIRISLLTEPLGIPRKDILRTRPVLYPAALTHNHIDLSKKIVALCPGSAWGTKKWPIEYFANLALKLKQDHGVGLFILGSLKEEPLATYMEEHLKKYSSLESVWNLAGRTTLTDLKGIYPKIALLISNDSSPVHFASAFNIPTIAIFGPTTPQMGFSPLADQSNVVEHKALHCRPCHHHGPQRCPLKHFKCMREITVDKVLNQCKNYLK